MTFLSLDDPMAFAKLDAERWCVDAVHCAMEAWGDGLWTPARTARYLQRELRKLAAAAKRGVDRRLAERVCAAVGFCWAQSIAAAASGSDAADDQFVNDRVADLDATIEDSFRDLAAGDDLAGDVERLLALIAGRPVAEFSDGEHVGDLMLAAANAVALDAGRVAPEAPARDRRVRG
jgi:hypothetical protein